MFTSVVLTCITISLLWIRVATCELERDNKVNQQCSQTSSANEREEPIQEQSLHPSDVVPSASSGHSGTASNGDELLPTKRTGPGEEYAADNDDLMAGSFESNILHSQNLTHVIQDRNSTHPVLPAGKKSREAAEEEKSSPGRESQDRFCAAANPKLYKEILPDLMEVVAGYLHTAEFVLVANLSNYGVCRGVAWRLYRRHFATTCAMYNNLSGYYPVLILLADAEDSGAAISMELLEVAAEIECGHIQVTHLIVLVPSSITYVHHPTQRINYCVVQPKDHDIEFREVYTFGPSSSAPAEEVVGWWIPGGLHKKLPYRAEIFAPTDFKGNVVRVVVIQSAPHVVLTRDGKGKLNVDGFLTDLMVDLSKRLNFSLEWIESSDQQHGIPLDNGTWTGLVGYLHRKEADVAVSPMSLTIPRLSVMDFSPAIDHDSVRMVIMKDLDLDPLDWQTYIVGFHWSVWLSLVAVWLIMSFGIAKIAEPDENISSYNYMFYFIGTIAQQGCATVPECGRGRVIVFTFWIGSVLLFTAYTACLTSQLAVVPAHKPFSFLTDAITSAGYYASTLKGTSYVSEMKTSRDEGLRLAYKQMMEDPTLLVNTVRDGINLLQSDNRKVLFMLDVSSVSFALQGNCSYMWIGPEYFPEYVYIGYSKNLSYANIFSNYISKAADYGITFKLRERWRGHQRQCNSDASFRHLGFSKTVLAFTVLGLGACLGFLLLFCETLFDSWSCRQLMFIFRSNETWLKLRMRRRSAIYRQVPEVRYTKNKLKCGVKEECFKAHSLFKHPCCHRTPYFIELHIVVGHRTVEKLIIWQHDCEQIKDISG